MKLIIFWVVMMGAIFGYLTMSGKVAIPSQRGSVFAGGAGMF